MSAIRLARAATGREKLLKFAGAYHGHVDGLLAEAGSGLATQGIPSSPGVPDGRDARTRSSSRGTTPRRSTARVRRARVRRDPRRAVPGEHGPRPAGRRLPRGAARRARPTTARCSSSTRSSPASASAPAAPRSSTGVDARPDRAWARSSAAACPPRRTAGQRDADGAHRAGRRRLPGGHAVGQPARGRRPALADAGDARRAGLPAPGGDDRGAGRRAARGRRRAPGADRRRVARPASPPFFAAEPVARLRGRAGRRPRGLRRVVPRAARPRRLRAAVAVRGLVPVARPTRPSTSSARSRPRRPRSRRSRERRATRCASEGGLLAAALTGDDADGDFAVEAIREGWLPALRGPRRVARAGRPRPRAARRRPPLRARPRAAGRRRRPRRDRGARRRHLASVRDLTPRAPRTRARAAWRRLTLRDG